MAIPSSAKHCTVHVTFGEQHADIDKGIAPLIREMWRAGIVTSQCCQDSPPGWIWLEFMSSFELEKFLDIVGAYENTVGSLHDRMLYGYDRLSRPRVNQWRVSKRLSTTWPWPSSRTARGSAKNMRAPRTSWSSSP